MTTSPTFRRPPPLIITDDLESAIPIPLYEPAGRVCKTSTPVITAVALASLFVFALAIRAIYFPK